MVKNFRVLVVLTSFCLMAAACATGRTQEQPTATSMDVVAATTVTDIATISPTATVEATVKATAEATVEATIEITVTPEETLVPEPTLAAAPESQTNNSIDDLSIDITLPLPDGDPMNGEELLTAKACAGCHLLGAIGAGPSWKAEIYAGGKGIATRAQERWQNDGYTGQATNATEYLVESILMPNAYVIEGYSQGTMPNTYREQLTDQELADIIAYLSEIK